jgi:hypothetical protein
MQMLRKAQISLTMTALFFIWSRFSNFLRIAAPNPVANYPPLEFLAAANFVSGHILMVYPFIDRVSLDAEISGNFIHLKPTFFHHHLTRPECLGCADPTSSALVR